MESEHSSSEPTVIDSHGHPHEKGRPCSGPDHCFLASEHPVCKAIVKSKNASYTRRIIIDGISLEFSMHYNSRPDIVYMKFYHDKLYDLHDECEYHESILQNYHFSHPKSFIEFIENDLPRLRYLKSTDSIVSQEQYDTFTSIDSFFNEHLKDQDSLPTCSVCLDNTSGKLTCGHGICLKCRIECISKNMKKCPLCRKRNIRIMKDETCPHEESDHE